MGMLVQLFGNQLLIGGGALYANSQGLDLLQVPTLTPSAVALGCFGALPLIGLGLLVEKSDTRLGAAQTRDTQAIVLRLYGTATSPAVVGSIAGLLCLVTGICEETSFRGLVFPVLALKLNPTLGWLASSLIFGFAHYSGGFTLDVLANLLLLSVCGLWFGGLAVVSGGNLAAPIIAHTLYDFQSMFGSYLAVSDRIGYVRKQMVKSKEWGELEEPSRSMVAVDRLREQYKLPDDFISTARAVFYLMDSKRNGVLDSLEFRQGLAAMGRNQSRQEVEEIFEAADIDKNGTLDFTEFLSLLVKLKASPIIWYRGLTGF